MITYPWLAGYANHTATSLSTVLGPSTGVVGTTYTFSYYDSGFIGDPFWTATGGSVTNEYFSGGTYYCQVQWTVAGTGVVSFRDGGFILGSKNVSVTGGAPSAPTTLTATAISGSQINLTWVDASSNETGFQVERSLTSGSDFTLITTTAANATSFSNTGLNAGTQYFYRVRSVNAGGNSAYTAEANATTTVAPPAVPTTLTATAISNSQINLTWVDASSNETGFQIERSLTSGSGFTLITTTAANATSFSNTGLNAGTSYFYRIRSVNAGGNSTFTSEAAISTRVLNFDQNYIRTVTAQKPGLTSEALLGAANMNEKQITYQFFDGLGRPSQTVAVKQSPNQMDIVQPIAYDAFGREAVKYLPYVSGDDGTYKTNFLPKEHTNYATSNNAQYQFYQNASSKVATDTRPYAETIFEPSPLNRPDKDYGAGQAWVPVAMGGNNKFIQHGYLINQHGTGSNATQEKIIAWSINGSGLPVRASAVTGYIVSGGYYATGQLHIKSTKDEQGYEVREYTNKSGQVILKKVQATSAGASNLNDLTGSTPGWALTYYIYDDLGNLVCEIQPEGTKNIEDYFAADDAGKDSFLNRWAFRYKYDGRRRSVEKQIPGGSPLYLVYDKRDRVVMSQDGNQRSANKWSFTKYDALNRPIITGIYVHNDSINQAQMSALISTTNFFDTYNGDASSHGYTNTVFPTTNADSSPLEILSVTYYDNYKFRDDLAGSSFNYVAGDITGQDTVAFNRVVGLVTGTKTNVLGASDYLWSVNYYDDKYRDIQRITQNHKGGFDRVTSKVDFVGKVLETKSTYSKDSVTSTTIRKRYEYDHAGRLLKTYHQLNSEPEILLSATLYNELGELVTKKLHSEDNGTTFKQHVDFRYSIRGWLTRINNADLSPDNINEPRDHFGMELAYNNVLTGINNTPQFNGNISATKYSTNQGFDPGLKERAYKYTYDPMSRLTAATHYEKAASWNMSDGLHEDNITYDLNTKMLSIRRKGADDSQMDNLVLDYGNAGNQLQSVTDSWDTEEGFADGNTVGADYTYDANGNRITDKNKGITAYTYNYMNQREKVTFQDGNYLLYVYDAMGNKLSQSVYNASHQLQKKTDYAGEFFYENDTLKYISHEEGRYNTLAGAYEYELRDHLGNNRVTFTTKEEHDEATATMETENLTEEQSKFLRYENARRISSHLFDKTNGSAPSTTPGYAVRLNGSANEQFGLARSFAVVPGDTVKTEVYVKYIDTNPSNWTTALNTLLTQIAGGTAPPGTVVDGGSYGSSTTSFPFPGLLNTSGSSGEGPKAYLNWLVFDSNFIFINGGYVRMTDAAKEYGQDCMHEKLSAEIPIITAGYVYVYLSNENESVVEVYYDEFSVDLKKSPVINATDLFPYGASAISYSREGSLKQDKLLNGKETQDELGYNVVDLGQRDIDPFVPVFPTIDRFSEKYSSMSPYQYTAGNPIKYVDVNGDSLWINTGYRNLLYEDGKLYTKSGKDVTHKAYKKDGTTLKKSFVGSAVGALGAISANGGENEIKALQESNFHFTIKESTSNGFYPTKGERNNAFAAQNFSDPSPFQGNNLWFQDEGLTGIGAGGTIYWNHRSGVSVDAIFNDGSTGSVVSNPIFNLAHELFHGYDSNFGALSFNYVLGNAATGVERKEGRAVYFENKIRMNMGADHLRLNYSGGRSLIEGGKPIKIPSPWYK